MSFDESVDPTAAIATRSERTRIRTPEREPAPVPPSAFVAGRLLLERNIVATIMLCVAMAGAPFLFGSIAPPTVAFWCLWLATALLLASPRALKRPHVLLLLAVVAIAVVFLCLLHEQSADKPWLASPSSIWGDASRTLGQAIPPLASVVRNAPFYSIGSIAANLLVLVLGLVVGVNRYLARAVLYSTMISGILYATYGIYNVFIWPDFILWREKEFYVGELTSTFTFRNTAAVYFGAITIICMLVFLEALRERVPKGKLRWRLVVSVLVKERHLATNLKLAGLLITLSALLMTHSRAGIVLSLGAVLLACWLFLIRDLLASANKILMVILLGFGSLAVIQILSGAVSERLNREGLQDAQRLETYKATLAIIADHPWFGTGLGTFRWIFPSYRTDQASIWGLWDTAHSTPLELIAEMGIPFGCVVAIAWLVALSILIRGAFRRKRDKIMPQAAVAVALLALAHSTVDFSLQIPGFSIVVFGLLGIGLAQAFGSQNTDGAPRGGLQPKN